MLWWRWLLINSAPYQKSKNSASALNGQVRAIVPKAQVRQYLLDPMLIFLGQGSRKFKCNIG
jgi:hypothetical protein